MTQQFDEVFILDGEQTTTPSRPLDGYLNTKPRPSVSVDEVEAYLTGSTGLHRGYIGTWTVRDDMLYLVGLDGPPNGPAMLWELFPDAGGDGVFAEWYTGKVRINQGVLYRYSKPYRHVKHQMEIVLEVVSGRVTQRSVVYNDPPPPEEPLPKKKWWQRLWPQTTD